MQCTLQYPCEFENANLRMMLHLKAVFPEIPIGLSDHTLGIAIPQAAVALGATIIEKHYTLGQETSRQSRSSYVRSIPRT